MEVKFKKAPNVPRLGDEKRVPSYAYSKWGLVEGMWKRASDECYRSEWEGGSPRQMQYVVEAITGAGLGNFSQMLRDLNAEAVAHLVDKHGRIRYLEPGAGVSTVNVYQTLQKKNIDLERVFATLVEPSETRLAATVLALTQMGLRENKNFKAMANKDTNVLSCVSDNSQDVISCVAEIHHHSYLDRPLKMLYRSLKVGGVIMIVDWHNSMWEHPARVLQALREDYEWPTKEEDLEAFKQAYPGAIEEPPELQAGDAEANRMIREFWKSYGRIKAEAIAKGEFSKDDDILMLEAHRPVERQMEEMERAGFLRDSPVVTEELIDALGLDGNPHQMLPSSRLLMFSVGVK